VAYGNFTQSPGVDYIKYSKVHQFESESASHYINFQYSKDNQTFRAETYYKAYDNLVKYNTPAIAYNSVFYNTGSGYAKGLDIFWRWQNYKI
jgi:ABC-type sulfate transport system substrate-binding protein